MSTNNRTYFLPSLPHPDNELMERVVQLPIFPKMPEAFTSILRRPGVHGPNVFETFKTPPDLPSNNLHVSPVLVDTPSQNFLPQTTEGLEVVSLTTTPPYPQSGAFENLNLFTVENCTPTSNAIYSSVPPTATSRKPFGSKVRGGNNARYRSNALNVCSDRLNPQAERRIQERWLEVQAMVVASIRLAIKVQTRLPHLQRVVTAYNADIKPDGQTNTLQSLHRECVLKLLKAKVTWKQIRKYELDRATMTEQERGEIVQTLNRARKQ